MLIRTIVTIVLVMSWRRYSTNLVQTLQSRPIKKQLVVDIANELFYNTRK